MKEHTVVCWWFGWLLLFLLVRPSQASTIVVQCCSTANITSGITAAANGDTVALSPGTYSGLCDITLGGPSKALTLDGGGAGLICSNNPLTVFTGFNLRNEGAGDVIMNLRLTTGATPINATGIYISSATVTVDRVTLSTWENAITVNYGGLTLTNSQFTLNTARLYGGAMRALQSAISVASTNFTYNTAQTYGSAIYAVTCNLAVTNSLFFTNTGAGSGGAGINLANANSNLTIINSIFDNNSANQGAAILTAAYNYVTISGSTFTRNWSGCLGSVIMAQQASQVFITSSVFRANTAGGCQSGAVSLTGGAFANITTSIFDNNLGSQGAHISLLGFNTLARVDSCNFSNPIMAANNQIRRGVYCPGDGSSISIKNSFVSGHSTFLYTENQGGPSAISISDTIFNRANRVVLHNCNSNTIPVTLTNITVINSGFNAPIDTGSGMIMSTQGPMVIRNCFFNNNTVDSGMIFSVGPLLVTGTTFMNTDCKAGGGINWLGNMGAGFVAPLNITNCTFIQNTARFVPTDAYGGAIYYYANTNGVYSITIENCFFLRNSANSAPAIYAAASFPATTMLIRNCTFDSHTSSNPGGVLSLGMAATITGTNFVNAASLYGGAIGGISLHKLTVTACTFTNVSAGIVGAIFYGGGGTSLFQGMSFSGYTAKYGAVLYAAYTSVMTVRNCSFINNRATQTSGGAIYMVFGTVQDSYFFNNSAAMTGGAIGTTEVCLINVTNCVFIANTAMQNGGALSSGIQGAMIVLNCYASDNVALMNGGAIHINYVTSKFILSGTTLVNNRASTFGGGLYIGEVMATNNATVTNCNITGNSAAKGGGIYSAGYISLSNTNITGNTAQYGGGLQAGNILSIAGGTISANSADFGGGIYCRLCQMNFKQALSITNNVAEDGGGFWCNAGSTFQPTSDVVFRGNTQAVDSVLSVDCECGCCALPDPTIVNITTPDCILAAGRQCGYSCSIGYMMGNPNGTFTCGPGSSGDPVFTPEILCLAIRCDIIDPPANATATYTTKSYANGPATGDITTFACDLGFTLVGITQVTCLGPDWLGGPYPTCEPNPCPVLRAPTDGTVSNLTGVYGNVVQFCCDDGFTLTGALSATCLGTGAWSNAVPLCQALPCQLLPNPENGTTSQDPNPKTGSVATFHCNDGYALIGNTTSVTCCGHNWSAIVPACAPQPCPYMPAPQNGTVSSHIATTGAGISFACDVGFYREGLSSLACIAQQWAGIPPTCEPATCETVIAADVLSDCPLYASYGRTCDFGCVAGTSGDAVTTSCVQTDEIPQGVFVPGLPVCSPCGVGSFSLDGATECTPCPNSGRTLAPRAMSQSECLCALGFYEATPGAGDCVECPAGGYCSGGKDQPIAAPGFFKNSDAFVACAPIVACTGDNKCEVGYTGFLCGSCSKGFYQLNGYCHVCPNDGPWRVIVVVLAGLVSVRAMIAVVKPAAFAERTYGFVSITIALSFFQVVATFSELKIQWPFGARAFFDIFSAFNLNIEVLNAECLAPLTFWDKTQIQLLMPLIVLAMFIVVGAAMILVYLIRERPDREHLKLYARKTVQLCSGAMMLFMSLAYLFLAKAALALFACQDQGGGVYTLRTAPSYLCYTGKWNELAPLGVFGIIFYIIAVPIVVHVVYFRARQKYGDTAARKSLYSNFLVNKYRPECWFWEFFIMLRKLLVVVVTTYGVGNPYGQVAASFAVILTAVLLSLPWHPYRWRKHNIVELIVLGAALGVLFCGLLLSAQSVALQPSVLSALDAAAIFFVVVAIVALVCCFLLEARIYYGVIRLKTQLNPDAVTRVPACDSRIVLISLYRGKVLTVSNEGSVRSWHQDTLLPARAFEMKEKLDFAVLRGKELYCARDNELLIWDLELNHVLDKKQTPSTITGITCCPEQCLVTAHESGDLLFWPFATELTELPGGTGTSAMSVVGGSSTTAGVRDSAMGPINPVFISEKVDSEGGENVAVTKTSVNFLKPSAFGVGEPRTVHAHEAPISALKAVGLIVYSAGHDGVVRKWSTKSFKHLRQWIVGGMAIGTGVHITAVEEVAEQLVVGASNGVLTTISVEAEDKVLRTLRMQIARISALALGRGLLLSASEDGRILVLHGASGRLLQMLPDAEAAVTCLNVLDDGHVVYGDARGNLRRYRIIPEWHMKEPDPMVFSWLWMLFKKRVLKKEETVSTTTPTIPTGPMPDLSKHDIYDELSVLAESLDLPAIPWRVLDSGSAEAVALALARETQKRRDHSDEGGVRRRRTTVWTEGDA